VFCPGCAHERITKTLDQAFQNMGLKGNQIVMVSDIGCSGLFDTFFHTHALHGLHGRALTYATGIKMARPELNVVVTMGDGGMGIGGAHLLSACRRNLNLTLLVLNNFNFGMTGGQYSATTPPDARVGSSFLNQLERPLDVCQVAASAGATYVTRCSAYKKNLAEEIERAIRHDGFSVLDIWGVCPGRFTRRNKLTPQMIDESLSRLPLLEGVVEDNTRPEYGTHYREQAQAQKPAPAPARIEKTNEPPQKGRQEVIILGNAGQRIITAGDLLCYAGLTAGMNTTQKNEYNITVLRGPSITEVILSPDEIGFTGIGQPDLIMAIGQEGVDRRKAIFDNLDEKTLVTKAEDIMLPPSEARVHPVDFKAQNIKGPDRALASLALASKMNRVLNQEMLQSALKIRFKGPVLDTTLGLVEKIT
jgi:pyruvate/2-oxoacid:ferredoxin oxidoreductase beta subunit/Pyruvate/2-oxoacid:ferredoxin oxidoreductase gamma subunit